MCIGCMWIATLSDLFQQILSAPLPSKRQQTQIAANDTLSVPTEDADDLTATNIPDLLANEQTWPTEEEMAGSTERTVEEPVVKKG